MELTHIVILIRNKFLKKLNLILKEMLTYSREKYILFLTPHKIRPYPK